uniref:autotransporter domain-containing protein n=1 Tax=Campylobacter pinnipediorum TaxID=1965231 RepID=UPI00112FA034
MKISKIACATLLGAIIATGAYAEDDVKNTDKESREYNIQKSKLEKARIAEEKIVSALQELKENVDKLKNYDPKNHDNGDSKIIYDILKKIKDARFNVTNGINRQIGDIDYGGGKHDIEYADKSRNKVVLKKRGTGLEITIKQQTKNFALVNGNADKNDYKTFFADEKIVLVLIDGFIQEFHKAVGKRQDEFTKREREYVNKLVSPDTDRFSEKDIDAINSIYKDLPKKIKEISDALGVNHKLKIGENSAGKEVEITIKDAKHAKVLSDAVTQLSQGDVKIEDAKVAAKVLMDAGVKLKAGKDLSATTEASKVKEALDIEDLSKIANKFTKDKKVNEAVQTLKIRDLLIDFNEDNLMIDNLDDQMIDKKNALTTALEEKDNQKNNKFTKQVAENNKKTNDKKITLSDDPKTLAEQKRALGEITKVLNSTAKDYGEILNNNQDTTKKKAFDEALAKAKAAGVVIAGDEDKKAESLKTKVTEALKVFNDNNDNDQIKAVVEAQQAFEDAEKAFYDSVSLRVNTFIKNPKNSLSLAAKDIISSMDDKVFLKNRIIYGYMISGKESLLSFVKSNETSIKEASSEIGKVSNLDMVNFSSQLSTQTRLAKLSNPFNEDLALASAINKLSNDKFADNGDSVSSIIKSYTDRFNNDNNIWANVIGAKGKVKDSTNPELHGFSIGYDRAFDNTIVGGYMTLAKSKSDSSLINTKASNYQFGLYARTYIDNSEIDTRVSFGKAKNKIQRNAIVNNQMLTQD